MMLGNPNVSPDMDDGDFEYIDADNANYATFS